MKCPNCGANMSVNDLKCVYCQTPNPEAAAFHNRVRQKHHFNSFLRRQIEKQMTLPLLVRTLNLSLWILGFLLLFTTVLYMGFSLLIENPFSSTEKETPAQAQMSILQYDYDQFLSHSMSCMDALEQKKLPDTYHTEYTIRYAQELLCPSIPAYPEIYEENKEQLALWQEEAEIFLRGIFSFTDEDLESFYPADSYDWFSYEERDALVTLVYQNLKKEGMFHEN